MKIPWKSQGKFRENSGNLVSQKCGHPDIGLFLNPPMVKPFRLTYLAKGRGGGGGGEGIVATPPLEILTIPCLIFCLLLTDGPALGLPENGAGGLEVVMLCDRFQQYVEIIRKSDEKCYNSFIRPCNDLESTG